MSISAAQVKDLRKQTGAGFMDCKKALVEAGGDMAAALEILQKKGADRRAGRAGRTTSEGVIALCQSALVEVLCETDFVARNEDFLKFADNVAWEYYAGAEATGLDIEKELEAISATTGEVVRIGTREILLETPVGSYLHTNRQVGSVVAVNGGPNAEDVARNVAMHVVASDPAYLDTSRIPEEVKEKQAQIFKAQASELGKPDHILDKIIQGKLNKWAKSQCLLTQPYVKDTDMTVGEYLKKEGVEVIRYSRRQVGQVDPDLV